MSPAIVAIRIRGVKGIRTTIEDAMRSLRLTRANHAVVLPSGVDTEGQLAKAKDYITFGTVDAAAVAKLIRARGRLEGDKPVTDEVVAKNSGFKGIDEFAAAIAEGKARYADLKGVTPIFRLNPPRGGFKGGVKRSVQAHGSLGDRGDAIGKLLERMI